MHATLAGHDRAVSCMGLGVMYHQAIKRFLAERAVSVNENLELIGVVMMLQPCCFPAVRSNRLAEAPFSLPLRCRLSRAVSRNRDYGKTVSRSFRETYCPHGSHGPLG